MLFTSAKPGPSLTMFSAVCKKDRDSLVTFLTIIIKTEMELSIYFICLFF